MSSAYLAVRDGSAPDSLIAARDAEDAKRSAATVRMHP